MGLKAGWLALFVFVWIIGAFFGSTFEYHDTEADAGQAYTTGNAAFTTGSSTVNGVGTVWVAAMEGGLIQYDADNTLWSKIDTVVNNTELTLAAGYQGAGGAAGAYTMAVSPGWAGTGGGGYAQSPVTTLEYLLNISNMVQRNEILGVIPLITPNGEYFKSAFKVLTWQWSFMAGYTMIYWIFFAPFAMMGVLSMILLVYGIITGNIAF
ncbi:hypothetical protein LCGC14_1207620 [marine sediment metagenome]|uniref:Uncharacterized protein n=1 Tax=marine sediment metagenome TaxID=412755 RepID=A0A0F9LEZ2_9ZZZZ